MTGPLQRHKTHASHEGVIGGSLYQWPSGSQLPQPLRQGAAERPKSRSVVCEAEAICPLEHLAVMLSQ